MFTVYVLKSLVNGRMYTGFTDDIEERLCSHNSGKVRSTKAYKPYSLVYKEEFSDKIEARKRENFLKSGKGRELMKEIPAACGAGYLMVAEGEVPGRR